MKSETPEVWDIYTGDRAATGRTHIRGTPLRPGDFHLVVEIWTVNTRGEILLTRRHPSKPMGGWWECTAGSATAGEDSRTAAQRELQEETGISVPADELRFLESYSTNDSIWDLWTVTKDIELTDLSLQPEEVSDARWVDLGTFKRMLEEEQVVPKLAYLFRLVETRAIRAV